MEADIDRRCSPITLAAVVIVVVEKEPLATGSGGLAATDADVVPPPSSGGVALVPNEPMDLNARVTDSYDLSMPVVPFVVDDGGPDAAVANVLRPTPPCEVPHSPRGDDTALRIDS